MSGRSVRSLFAPRHADRVIAATFGAWFLYAAVWLWLIWLDDSSDAVPVFYDWAWPYVFAVAGLVGIAYAIRPQERHLAAWSGGLMIAALLSRAFTILASWLTDQGAISAPRAMLGASVWTILGWALGIIWTEVLRPLNERRRKG